MFLAPCSVFATTPRTPTVFRGSLQNVPTGPRSVSRIKQPIYAFPLSVGGCLLRVYWVLHGFPGTTARPFSICATLFEGRSIVFLVAACPPKWHSVFFKSQFFLEVSTARPGIPDTCLSLRSVLKRSSRCVSGIAHLLLVLRCAFPVMPAECFVGILRACFRSPHSVSKRRRCAQRVPAYPHNAFKVVLQRFADRFAIYKEV